ncbi:MAG: alpha/beta hydrolase [Pirellulales bacterium]
MPIDADSEKLLALTQEFLTEELHKVSIEDARRMLASVPGPPTTPEMHRVEDLVVEGPAGGIPVRTYAPIAADDLPVIVWLHGGGWALGDLEISDPFCRELATATGAVVVAVDYRLAPEFRFPIGLEDCYAATKWVVENPGSISGDSDRIAIGGDSAGANLAIGVCLLARERSGPRLIHQGLAYPCPYMRVSNPEFMDGPAIPASLLEYLWGLYFENDADRLSPYAAPLNAEDLSGLPGGIVIVPEVDPLRDDQELLAGRLAQAGVAVTCKRYPGTYHSFLPATALLPRAQEAMADLANSFRAAFLAASEADSDRANA